MSNKYGTIAPTRNLSGARAAFTHKDPTLSREAHMHGRKADEGHAIYGESIKSIVYGGVDGILTSFAIISGAAGGHLTAQVILVIGLSNVFADAISMGVGDAVSTISYNEHVENERRRECWEFDNFPEGEIEEMVDLYEQRGLPREKAEVVVTTMAKYRDLFIDVMMCEELQLKVPEPDESPWKDGAVTFISFLVFGMFPVLGYILLPLLYPSASSTFLFGCACVITMVTLFTLGCLKSKFSTMVWWKSGLQFMGLGCLCAATSYFIAALVAYLGDEYFHVDGLPAN